MTDLRKAAEMALDALEKGTTGLAIRAIPALRQALAQEQIKCPRCGEVNPAEIHTCSPQVAQPEQEELIQFKDGKWSYVRKPWVGLTDDEIIGHTCECVDDGTFDMNCAKNFANFIQETLKRYNT